MNRNKFLTLLLLLGLIILAIGFMGCSGKKATHEGEIVKIGAILPLSGPIGYFGKQEKNAINLALHNFKAKGLPLRVKVLFEDHKNNPTLAVNAFQKLILDKRLVAVLTQMSSVCMKLAKFAPEYKIPLVSLCMHPLFAETSKYAFRVYESVGDESYILAYYIKENEKINTITVMYINDDWGIEAANTFKETFKKIAPNIQVSLSAYDKAQLNFKSEVTEVLSKEKEAIFIAGYGPSVIAIVKAIREINPRIKIFGNVGMSWRYVIKSIPSAFNNVIIVMPVFDAKYKENEPFVKEYYKLYNEFPEAEAAYTYDAFSILLGVIEKLWKEHKTINKISVEDELVKIRKFRGVSGILHFTKDGEAWPEEIAIRKISNGVLETIKIYKNLRRMETLEEKEEIKK